MAPPTVLHGKLTLEKKKTRDINEPHLFRLGRYFSCSTIPTSPSTSYFTLHAEPHFDIVYCEWFVTKSKVFDGVSSASDTVGVLVPTPNRIRKSITLFASSSEKIQTKWKPTHFRGRDKEKGTSFSNTHTGSSSPIWNKWGFKSQNLSNNPHCKENILMKIMWKPFENCMWTN